MPKTTKAQSALKKTRNLFKKFEHGKCETSDSEESTFSVESGDLAHIPIENTPLLDNLSLEDESQTPFKMEHINIQLEAMSKMMSQFVTKQQEHDDLFRQIDQQLSNTTPAVQTLMQPGVQPTATFEQLSRIPDPIKMIPAFDGNTKQLNAWLATAEETLDAFQPHVTPMQYKMYVTAVINKIQGRAKDIICLAGNPESFGNVKEILVNALGDRQELSTYKCQLWQCRMLEGMNVSKYYNKSKSLVQSIKTLAKQKEKYRNNWEVINEFIEEDALAAFIAGLSEPYFGYAQAARPKDMEDAYAFLCKFKSKEIAAHSMASFNTTNKFQRYNDESKSNRPQVNSKNQNYPNKVQKYQNTEYQKPERPETEPMDATTTRSRLTLNKRTINNHETTNHDAEDEISEDSNSEYEPDNELDLNFHSVCMNRKPV